jgi:putative ABC transport system substrate-binding protein
VVFAVVTDPLGAGIVKSIKNPGGNVTGVTFGIQEERRLEWFLRIAPEAKHLYVPYNPKDKSPLLALKRIKRVAVKLDVKLITRKVNKKTLNFAVNNIPSEADGVFLLPDSMVTIPEMISTVIKNRLPVSGPNISNVKNDHVLTSYGVDLFLSGKQAARIVNQIFKGARPADLPVETAEFFLALNLKMAKKIGLTIPDEILRHAHIIVR